MKKKNLTETNMYKEDNSPPQAYILSGQTAETQGIS